MQIKLQTIEEHARHATGKRPGDPVSSVLIANHAGQAMVQMHPWIWLTLANTTLDYTAAQAYLPLPDNCREVTGLAAAYGVNVGPFARVSMDRLLLLRSSTTTATNGVNYYAASYNPTTGVQRIELAWAPATTVAGAVSVAYKAGWRRIDEDDEAVVLPDFMEPLYLRLVRAVAASYMDEGLGPAQDIMRAALSSVEFENAKSFDGRIMSAPLRIRGTLGEQMEASKYDWGSPEYIKINLA
jgi:hypothetical protein